MTKPARSLLQLVASLSLVAAPCAARATIYECGDRDGPRVFTDSPAQLKNCVPVGGASHAATPRDPAFPQASPMPTMAPQPEPPVDLDRPPSYVAPPVIPPPGTPPVADRDIGPPVPHEPVAGAPPESNNFQRCASHLNPFNPLMAIPCPPSHMTGKQTAEPEGMPAPPLPPEIVAPAPEP